MPDDSRFVAESIEEMLVALADGVREAQEALSDAQPVDVFGRPMPTYHIPYLDFEIAVEIETQRQDNGNSKARQHWPGEYVAWPGPWPQTPGPGHLSR